METLAYFIYGVSLYSVDRALELLHKLNCEERVQVCTYLRGLNISDEFRKELK